MNIDALQASLRRLAGELLQFADQTAIALDDSPGVKTHVLIDWENVQPSELECRQLVPEATDVWLFRGRTQKQVAGQYTSFGGRATEVAITRSGKNALDFHLSFYMGYIASKQPDARFVVLSNDKGYGPMLAHAMDLGFVVSQSCFTTARARKTAARKTTARTTTARTATTRATTARAPAAKKVTAPKAEMVVIEPAQNATPRPAKKAAAKKAGRTSPVARKAVAKAPAARKKTVAAKAPAKKTVAAAPTGGTSAAAPSRAKTKSLEQVLAILRKSSTARRPNKRTRLLSQIASLLGGDDAAAEAMIGRLVGDGYLTIDGMGAVGYRL